MTRFVHDQFAKDYLEELLTPFGEVKAPRRVSGEVREIDVWFAPTNPNQANTKVKESIFSESICGRQL